MSACRRPSARTTGAWRSAGGALASAGNGQDAVIGSGLPGGCDPSADAGRHCPGPCKPYAMASVAMIARPIPTTVMRLTKPHCWRL